MAVLGVVVATGLLSMPSPFQQLGCPKARAT